MDSETEDEVVDKRDEPEGDVAAAFCDGFVFAEEGKDLGGEDEDWEEDGEGDEVDDPGALEVDAHHVVLPGPEGLAAESFGRA